MTRSARRTPASPSVSSLLSHDMSFVLTHDTGQVGKSLGDKWKALSETDRKPYDDKAAADKKRYEEEKAKYQAVSFPSTQRNEALPMLTILQQQAEEDEDESS